MKKYWVDSHKESVGERRIKNWLILNNIFHLREAMFSDNVNPKTNQNLIFDFWLPEYNTVIEYQGEQHTKHISKFHGNKKLGRFEKQKEKDNNKREYCFNKGIKMLEIFWKDWDSIEKILEKNLKRKKK